MNDQELAEAGGFRLTTVAGVPLFHQTPTLGPGVAENVVAVIRRYAISPRLTLSRQSHLMASVGLSRGGP